MINRKNIYYWKCDRGSAFSTLRNNASTKDILNIESLLNKLMRSHFGSSKFTIRPAGGQGNHMTFLVENNAKNYFLRLENGPEKDRYMEVEARVLDEVRAVGVPTPKIYGVDATRMAVPFAYQIMEFIQYPDLNSLFKRGNLDLLSVAEKIGAYLARWQSIHPEGFGPFDPEILRQENKLSAFHKSYRDYFLLNLNKHLDFLVQHFFFTDDEAAELLDVVYANEHYLTLDKGCLVHKDLALWNILGDEQHISAIIDWDDTISGDPMDDISLLACFHSNDVVSRVLKGYQQVRPLPDDYLPRFWLHLLRNMIVKAVIRVGGDYFKRQDDFFLIGAGLNGGSLKKFTKARISTALRGLKETYSIEHL